VDSQNLRCAQLPSRCLGHPQCNLARRGPEAVTDFGSWGAGTDGLSLRLLHLPDGVHRNLLFVRGVQMEQVFQRIVDRP
jgi:hypothetical protein